MDIEQAKLSDEEQDNCTPTDNEIQKHLNDKGILPERIKDPEKRKLLIAAILYGENICNAQIAKVLRLLVEKAGETPQLVKTEPVDFGDLDSFFERGAEAQLEADNAHYRPIIGALKAEIERLEIRREQEADSAYRWEEACREQLIVVADLKAQLVDKDKGLDMLNQFWEEEIGKRADVETQLATARESNTALEKEVERLKKELAWYSKHAGAALSKEGEEK